MKIAKAVILAALVAAPGAATKARAQVQCPIGSIPWVDAWGDKICRRQDDGSTATTQAPRGQACPTGTHPWVDTWGNQVCRPFNAAGGPSSDLYDTSEGCPTGTHEWVDNWGNKVCKRF